MSVLRVRFVGPDLRTELAVDGAATWIWRTGEGPGIGTWTAEVPASARLVSTIEALAAAGAAPRDPANEAKHLEVELDGSWVRTSLATGGLDPAWAEVVDAATALLESTADATAVSTAAARAELSDRGLTVRLHTAGTSPVRLRIVAVSDPGGASLDVTSTSGLYDAFLGAHGGIHADATVEPDEDLHISWVTLPAGFGGSGRVVVEGRIGLEGPVGGAGADSPFRLPLSA